MVTILVEPKFKSAAGPVVRVRTRAGRVFYFQSGTAPLETSGWLTALAACPGVGVLAEEPSGEEDKGGLSTSASTEVVPASPAAGSDSLTQTGPAGGEPADAAASPPPLPPGGVASGTPRTGPRALDPLAELGVSGDVVAAIAELNSEVQTAWEAVLAAALRSRGLEQMQHVERELSQAQARTDAAQIATLTTEVAALHRELDDLRGGAGLLGENEVLQELRRALRQVETLRRDVDLAASACEAAQGRDADVERDVASRSEAALLAELRSTLGLPVEVAAAASGPTDAKGDFLRGVAGAIAVREAAANALRCAVRDVCAASGLPVPASVVELLLGEDTRSSEQQSAQRPPSKALRPPPNKPPRNVLQSQVVDPAARATSGVGCAGPLLQSTDSTPAAQPPASTHPALLELHRACEDAVLRLELLDQSSNTGSPARQGSLSGPLSRVRQTLIANVTVADGVLSAERDSLERGLESTRREAETLRVQVRDLQRSILEHRRAAELAASRCTVLELQLLDHAAEADLHIRNRVAGDAVDAASGPLVESSSVAVDEVPDAGGQRRALAEARAELAALRDDNVALRADCDAAKSLAARAREEAAHLALVAQRTQQGSERATSAVADLSRELATARALVRDLELRLASRSS